MPTTATSQISLPPFVADRDSLAHDSGHTIDWANVPEDYRETRGQTITVDGVAAQGATAITVLPLTYAVPAGTVLYFSATEFAKVTTLAAQGATSLVVEALVNALEGGETATITGSGMKRIPAGTRMYAGADHSDPMVPRTAALPASCILATDADESSRTDAKSGYGVFLGGVFYENMLPGATGTPKVIPSAEKTELQTAGVGTGYAFRQYRDNTA